MSTATHDGATTTQVTTEPQDSGEHKIRPIPVIAHGEVSTESESWTQRLELEESTILTVCAYTRAHYSKAQKTTANAGVKTLIKLNGEEVAADQSFEAQSDQVLFHSNASFSRFLKRGLYNLEVTRENLGNVDNAFLLKASYHAVAARRTHH